MAFESRQLFLYQITLTATMAILIQIIITPVAWCAVEFELLQIKHEGSSIHMHVTIILS